MTDTTTRSSMNNAWMIQTWAPVEDNIDGGSASTDGSEDTEEEANAKKNAAAGDESTMTDDAFYSCARGVHSPY